MAAPLQVGCVGSTIELTVVDESGAVVDISTATLTNALFLRSPRAKLLRKTPSFVTDGTDGKVEYDTIAGDISEAGQWSAQLRVVRSGESIPTSTLPVPVLPNLFP